MVSCLGCLTSKKLSHIESRVEEFSLKLSNLSFDGYLDSDEITESDARIVPVARAAPTLAEPPIGPLFRLCLKMIMTAIFDQAQQNPPIFTEDRGVLGDLAATRAAGFLD